MSRTYLPPTNQYVAEGNHFVVTGDNIHKVSGTSMAGILGCSPWSSPFQVACNLLGLAREDISDKPAVKVGIALEEKIIRYADKTYPNIGAFFPADAIYAKRAGDHDSWTSDFGDDYFAGHVDGIVMTDDGEDFILEIKTSSNMESWIEGVPEYYYLQVALYNHFITKKDKAYVVLGIVNENTYADYHSWIPSENTVALFPLKIDQEEFAKTLDTVREWYDKYIRNGVTPDYDPTNPGDVEMYNHLVSLAMDVDEVRSKLDAYYDVVAAIDNLEAENKDKYDAREELKKTIKDYMEAHRLSALDCAKGGKATLSSTTKTKLDELAMERDGIDLEKYRKTTYSKTFRFKM